jgi:hypothetical protein
MEAQRQNPNPSHTEGFGTPASFNRPGVHSGAARKGLPPAHGDAGVEAAGFTSAAPAEKTQAVGAEMAMGGSPGAETPTVLAATFLRLQCVEREEKEREDELHAFQSGEDRTGDTSERLALEQLWFLFQSRH